ncbi:hypothetical protein GcM1_244039 [Golovinomyces cichoracearum]|uniref:Uncharacterized protein n=1 Tax=Golovinomyces cichoracearum TaxID=62708 RepID=A0A420IFN8_9PEZI|nr:hypothetical protein GcM1_244039 [Golovinomyces cichoracearum]
MSFYETTEIRGSPIGIARIEGNYASTSSDTGHQETDQGLTLSPKIPLKKLWSHQCESISFDKEIDALFESVRTPCDSENQDFQSSESPSKRRRLNEPSTSHELSDFNVLTGSNFKTVSIGPTTDPLSPSTGLTCNNPNDPRSDSRDTIENASLAQIPTGYEGYANKDELPLPQQACNLINGNDDLDKLLFDSISVSMKVSSNMASTNQLQIESSWHESHTSQKIPIHGESTEPLPVASNKEQSNQSRNLSSTTKPKESSIKICDESVRVNKDSVEQNAECDNPTRSYRSVSQPITEGYTPSAQSDRNGLPSDTGKNQRNCQKLISSFPMTCLLELAGSNKDFILALITELVTYGDYKNSSPNYQIPRPYRRVFDELLSQWSQGTPNNELRKSLIAYIKEKIEAQIIPEVVNEKINQPTFELSNSLTGEGDKTNEISQWIDEVKLMQDSSKNLLRYVLGRSREYMLNLRDNSTKLQAENVQLRENVQRLSTQLHEYETISRSAENIRVNQDCSDSISIQSRNESPEYHDYESAHKEANEVDSLQVNELSSEVWICCERNSIAKGQIKPINQDHEKVGRPWSIRKTCTNCMRPNSERRYYIIREQVLAMSWEKFKEMVDSSSVGKAVFSPTSDVTENESTPFHDPPSPNPLYDVAPLSETNWEAVSTQMTTWPTSMPDFTLDSNATENLVIGIDKENWLDSNSAWELSGLQKLVEEEETKVK